MFRQTHFAAIALLGVIAVSDIARAADPTIEWEVKNRFRLFTDTTDFQEHAKLSRDGKSIFDAETELMGRHKDGRGWAEQIVAKNRLCFQRHANSLPQFCKRDGTREIYLSPETHRVGFKLADPQSYANATCKWTFSNTARKSRTVLQRCADEVIHDTWHDRPTSVTVEITRPDGTKQTASKAGITVRDYLIAGLGDSIASGEGNPEVPVKLGIGGFCFHRIVGGTASSFYRPYRAGYRSYRDCITPEPNDADPDPALTARIQWRRFAAEWMSPACHRSLYGYQIRAALQIATENPHIAVTYLPLGCSGATIAEGMLKPQSARELRCDPRSGAKCSLKVESQISQLTGYLKSAREYKKHRENKDRELDLLLLTIGANDIGFSELVTQAIVENGTPERKILTDAKKIRTVDEADRDMRSILRDDFAKLRDGLKLSLGGSLDRVLYVSYGNPAYGESRSPCGSTRKGFDIHPAFSVSGSTVASTVKFVNEKFFPTLRHLATCGSEGKCQSPEQDKMHFSAGHQTAFMQRGFCATANSDPKFDTECFLDGKSFHDRGRAGVDPLTCNDSNKLFFKAYTSRQRWIRTANDSYFAALSYPDNLDKELQAADIHKGIWGITSAVYGGAIHPTSEGHAAMADAALPKARCILGIAPAGANCADILKGP